MDETWKHYSKWNKPNTKGQTLYDSPWYEISRIVKFIENMIRIHQGLREGEWVLLLNGYRFYVWGDKNVFKIVAMNAIYTKSG